VRVELSYTHGIVRVSAHTDDILPGVEVASGESTTLEGAVKKLVSSFADMQRDTIDALNASGIIRYVGGSEGEAS
jgi:hypothetical protein